MKRILIGVVGIIIIAACARTYWGYQQIKPEESKSTIADTSVTDNSIEKKESGTDIILKNRKVGDTWVDGDYQYKLEKRIGEYYYMTGITNLPDCLDRSKAINAEIGVCTGGATWGKIGEIWSQSTTDSINCQKIIELGFPKELGATIASCYQ